MGVCRDMRGVCRDKRLYRDPQCGPTWSRARWPYSRGIPSSHSSLRHSLTPPRSPQRATSPSLTRPRPIRARSPLRPPPRKLPLGVRNRAEVGEGRQHDLTAPPRLPPPHCLPPPGVPPKRRRQRRDPPGWTARPRATMMMRFCPSCPPSCRCPSPPGSAAPNR